eukprot:TRINITY_DN4187_c0_g1_i3.p1 TRINITY_DN4187_c0_g1~~TRINITY_DN4187_c0_g1_i3.p1  ORF type:complete len:653 (-),score=121.11 TRINITY_DN4187_c0_g1_i3:57-2015(-)
MAAGLDFAALVSAHDAQAAGVSAGEPQQRGDVVVAVSSVSSPAFISPSSSPPGGQKGIIAPETKSIGSVGWAVYREYVAACGGIPVFVLLVVLFASDSGSRLFSDFWLAMWSSYRFPNRASLFYLGIYMAACTCCLLFKYGHDVIAGLMGLSTARAMHRRMLESVLRSPLGFFDATPVGRLLNRFTKDVNSVDVQLPQSIAHLLSMSFALASILVAISLATPFFLVVFLPFAAVYLYVRRLFIGASRDLNRLDSMNKSPIFTSLEDTFEGMSTIRAFGPTCVASFLRKNTAKIEESLRSSQMQNAATRWLGLRLDLMSAFVMTVATALAIMQSGVNTGLAALSITYSANTAGIFNWFVRTSSDVETQFVSAERVVEYMRLAPAPGEDPAQPLPEPREDWPPVGGIDVKQLTVCYREGLDPVLHDVSFSVHPGEKFGVCGRTGAGKSTLALVLLRLVEPSSESSVEIDGIDIRSVPATMLRSRLSIIPQDPVLFAGSLRSNLDPWGTHADSELEGALKSCGLTDHLPPCTPEQGGLLSLAVQERGGNLSMGQRQLICLARAVLCRAKILIMDEATAAVDYALDAAIQETIRREFSGVTVVTIAHRLSTLLDYDRVAVLERGRLAELDAPAVLLRRPDSLFAALASVSRVQEDR